MKRLTVFFMALVFALCMAGNAQAIPTGVNNLLQNSSFEDWTGTSFEFWSESGDWKRKSVYAYDGDYYARLGMGTGSLFQSFYIPYGDTLYFGAYFSFITNNIGGGNWDQAQINMQIAGLPDTTIGGSVSSFQGLSWEPVTPGSATHRSNWILLAGTVDILGISLPAASSINISLQNFNPANTRVNVDSAYAGVKPTPVPEPGTLLLLGSGLLGLLGFARRKSQK